MKIPYGKQNITQEDIDAVINTLTSDFLTQGPAVKEFEDRFAEYVGAKYAIAVTNGTAALHLAAMAMEVNTESKVICTPITFVASSNCVLYCDGKVEFSDINPENFLMDLDKLGQKLASSPKGTYAGIIPVDFAGYPVDLEKLRSIANKYDLWIIEDACHAPGASFIDSKGKVQKVGNGNYADLTVFSFHPVKHIATGEGGMITTNSEELYNRLITLRTHGITKNPDILEENHGGWYYEMHDLGYNYRITDIQCALGTSQLKNADQNVKRRQEIAAFYNDQLNGLPISLPRVDANSSHAYHLYVIQTDQRKALYEHLRNANIFSQIHYIPVHLQPFYKKHKDVKQESLPVAEEYYENCLSLPMYPSITEEELNYVVKTITSFFKK